MLVVNLLNNWLSHQFSTRKPPKSTFFFLAIHITVIKSHMLSVYTKNMPSNGEEFALLPWLCTSETLPGSWWLHRRRRGSPLCVFPPTTPPPRAAGFHPASHPSTLWPSWLWSQHAAGPAAHSSTLTVNRITLNWWHNNKRIQPILAVMLQSCVTQQNIKQNINNRKFKCLV